MSPSTVRVSFNIEVPNLVIGGQIVAQAKYNYGIRKGEFRSMVVAKNLTFSVSAYYNSATKTLMVDVGRTRNYASFFTVVDWSNGSRNTVKDCLEAETAVKEFIEQKFPRQFADRVHSAIFKATPEIAAKVAQLHGQ